MWWRTVTGVVVAGDRKLGLSWGLERGSQCVGGGRGRRGEERVDRQARRQGSEGTKENVEYLVEEGEGRLGKGGGGGWAAGTGSFCDSPQPGSRQCGPRYK